MKLVRLGQLAETHGTQLSRLRSMREIMWYSALFCFFLAVLLLPTTGLVITLLGLPLWSLVLPSLAFFFFALSAFMARNYVSDTPSVNIRQLLGLAQQGNPMKLETAVSALHTILGDDWSLYAPVKFGELKLDGVLLGEAGVFALTIENLAGSHRYTGSEWEWQNGRGEWIIEANNPYVAMTKNGRSLWFYLQEQGIVAPVYDRLVWLGDNLQVVQDTDRQRVWFLPNGAVAIRADVTNHPTLASETVAQIDALLRRGEEIVL